MNFNGLEIEKEHLIFLQYFQKRKEEEAILSAIRQQTAMFRLLMNAEAKSPAHEMKLLNGDKI